MSMKWPGGLIRKTPVTPAGPFENGAAPGMWTLAEAAYWRKQNLWPIAGNEQLFVENVFSTWLYTGNGGTQTITNGINLAGKGGLVWVKNRGSIASHAIFDTARGALQRLQSNTTAASASAVNTLTGFGSTGFDLGSDGSVNSSGANFASWTFREAPKFFDVVTYTGTGVFGRAISHNLGVAPGCILVKCLDDGTLSWRVYHRSLTIPNSLILNSTAAQASDSGYFTNTAPTSTEFYVGDSSWVNGNTKTYVAYLYAHDTTSDGIIQCGSFTATGSTSVNLGWEPQWVLVRRTDSTGFWEIIDNMRGFVAQPGTNSRYVMAQSTNAEADFGGTFAPTATGFVDGHATGNYIYIAIRRGPMRTPTVGTSVFAATATAAASGTTITTNFPVDLNTVFYRDGTDSANTTFMDKLRGLPQNSSDTTSGKVIRTSSTAAEITNTSPWFYTFDNTGWKIGALGGQNSLYYSFRRAPSFFDEVCYTGVNATQTLNHNLGVAPELIIVKNRTTGGTGWPVWATPFSGTNDSMLLNTTAAKSASGLFTTTPPTSTVFTVANDSWINSSGNNYVAYLFASCPGVSKVGSYTGTGALQTINCGFTTGARFVLIKRTDSTGDWYVWDSARGISSGNDPYLLLNSTAAEVTGTNYVDTDTTGFKVTAAAPADINASGGSYIFLAIA